ncbi:Fe-S-containing protein [Gilliamella apis]|uniref:Fe-S-containing protein n=1 Tax=Gilliamella apis TaxID=1970738 RepID=UPI002741D565|nr:Fe-S-containing protein [Gilliamella apis]WLT07357.1 Fe-S-containing protein [Gilliamella apis]
MLQYLISITDNTFVPVIILALVSAVFVQSNLYSGKKYLIIGFLLGMLAAIIYAILKRNTGIAVREYYDLGVIFPWCIIVIPLLICWSIRNSFQQPIIKILLAVLTAVAIGLITAQCLPNILLYPFGFDVGMESIFNNDYLFKWVGYGFALLVCGLIGWLIYRLCARLSTRLVMVIATFAIIIFTIQNAINLLQILIVRRFISPQQWMMDLVIFILAHVNLFTFIFMVLVLLLTVLLYTKAKTTSLVGNNPAQIRKLKASLRRDRRTSLLLMAGVAITAYTVTRARYIFEKGVELTPAEPVTLNADGLIVIPLEQVNDGNLHRYGYQTTDGTLVRFIVIKKSENAYGVGFDACDICGASGYYQRGNQVVCILCDVVMNIATIGFSGGCNPVPLKYEILDGNMIIRPTHLEAEKSRFK